MFIDLPIFKSWAKACFKIRYSQVVFHQENHQELHVGIVFYLEMMLVVEYGWNFCQISSCEIVRSQKKLYLFDGFSKVARKLHYLQRNLADQVYSVIVFFSFIPFNSQKSCLVLPSNTWNITMESSKTALYWHPVNHQIIMCHHVYLSNHLCFTKCAH